jgi:DNA-binding NarL/FixJ family response regulator
MESVSGHTKSSRLLIADDHAIFAEALRVYLEKTHTILGLVRDGPSMVTEAIRIRPDVIVVDVGMPLLNGLDAARKINVQAPDIKFVFLTMRDDPNLAAAALELGPIGFVLKHSPGQELLKAIDHVLRGKSYLTPKLRAGDWEIQQMYRNRAASFVELDLTRKFEAASKRQPSMRSAYIRWRAPSSVLREETPQRLEPTGGFA